MIGIQRTGKDWFFLSFFCARILKNAVKLSIIGAGKSLDGMKRMCRSAGLAEMEDWD